MLVCGRARVLVNVILCGFCVVRSACLEYSIAFSSSALCTVLSQTPLLLNVALGEGWATGIRPKYYASKLIPTPWHTGRLTAVPSLKRPLWLAWLVAYGIKPKHGRAS